MNAPRQRCLRHELKYHIDLIEYRILQKKLRLVLKHDTHATLDGRYHVRSLYFDDFRNTALVEKDAGVARRKKYRLRIYNFSDAVIKLERKTKLERYIVKETARLTREEAERIIVGDIAFLAHSENALLKTFYLDSRLNIMRPVVFVDYLREAYVHPIGNVRITFDVGLRMGLGPGSLFDPDAPTVRVADEAGIILEIKFNEVLPQHIRGLFPTTIQPRSAIGKFVICRTQQPCRETEFYMFHRYSSAKPQIVEPLLLPTKAVVH